MLDNLLASGEKRYLETLQEFKDMDTVWDYEAKGSRNAYFNSLDAVCLYGMIAKYQPRQYVEIGSGYSTMVAADAKAERCFGMRIHSIDPEPRIKVDGMCDFTFRRRLAHADVEWIVSGLEQGDILFVDGSHIADSTDSDVSILFTEIIPDLRPGVLVHLHDIWLPEDYPSEWAERKYNEQYILATYLTACFNAEIILPNGYISTISKRYKPYGEGKSFWFTHRNTHHSQPPEDMHDFNPT